MKRRKVSTNVSYQENIVEIIIYIYIYIYMREIIISKNYRYVKNLFKHLR